MGSEIVPASQAGEDLTQGIQAYRTTGRVREVAVLRRDSQSCSGFQWATFGLLAVPEWVILNRPSACLSACRSTGFLLTQHPPPEQKMCEFPTPVNSVVLGRYQLGVLRLNFDTVHTQNVVSYIPHSQP